MARVASIVLGIGLVVLWIIGLNTATSPGWLTWCDLVAGLCGFAIASARPSGTSARLSPSAITLAITLFVLWIVALGTGANTGMTWANFGFACAFLLAGIAGDRRPLVGSSDLDRPDHPFRRTVSG